MRQTAGRGTAGRSWSDAPGNLFLSVLVRPGTPAADAPRWSLLAGLAVQEALCAYAPVQLKWPNDLMLDGGKLAGILIESEATPDGRLAWLVIGIGANLAHAPRLADRATAALPSAPAPEPVARFILARIDHWRSAPFAAIRDAWIARAHPIGTRLTLTAGPITRTGTFAGLAESGALLLRQGETTHSYMAGEARILLAEPAPAH